MDDIYFFLAGETGELDGGELMKQAEWWFLLSTDQKYNHLYIDSPGIEDKHINLLLKVYDEEKETVTPKG